MGESEGQRERFVKVGKHYKSSKLNKRDNFESPKMLFFNEIIKIQIVYFYFRFVFSVKHEKEIKITVI